VTGVTKKHHLAILPKPLREVQGSDAEEQISLDASRKPACINIPPYANTRRSTREPAAAGSPARSSTTKDAYRGVQAGT
jgi:hypothetical protein